MRNYMLYAITGLLLLLTACNSNRKELHVYCWSDYIKPGIIEEFEHTFNCKVVLDTFESNEAMYAKLKAGATGYDIIFPSSYYVEMMHKQGLLQKIDPSLIPNLKYVDLNFPIPGGAQALELAVPYMVSYTGIGYRIDKVQRVSPTWEIFARRDLKGRMTMLNDVREALGAALKSLGYSLNSTDDFQIAQAASTLINWKRNLAKFDSEQYKNGIASAEYLVVQGYSGDLIQVMQEDANIGILYPQEGTAISIDEIIIPKHAPEVQLAHAFINFLLEPKRAAENMEFVFFISPNTAAAQYLSPKVRNNPALNLPNEILQRSEVIHDLSENNIRYISAWETVKEAL
ncbi:MULTISPECIES: ABC transporter substrate-binding protein [Parachlamydia]|jgi:spermidine/putrescine transport system substrate-binding protein|uniref:Spermidine/putrescine-binding periplasmic protein n=2 Tax=Parachlamydia acanthamoebae TaxID=83552 RepID=F8KXX7_PARAV|nr:spermidine/putrescine ABC transporter substrate-binding protein [Parachlamydia acanthamoebae]CCB85708.1 spermidine/putrescine-binding periplasmic protein [Parachlamydia acanthamoebae UV-7]